MLIEICHGSVSFGAETILSDINFIIKNTEKIAITGRNGCGKTTLLNLISGRIGLDRNDSGQDIFISRQGELSVGYLQQNVFKDDSVTLEQEVKKGFRKITDTKEHLDELLERMENGATEEIVQKYVDLQEQFQNMGGYEYEKEYELIIQKFGFSEEDKQKKLREFSGGQRTRIAFARMLLGKPDILLLDEPTNHMLKNYTGTVLFVSHDRYFIKQVADMLLVFEDGIVKCFPEGYEQYQEALGKERG